LTLAEIVGMFPLEKWDQILLSINRLRQNGLIFRKRRQYSYNFGISE